jgi:tRNA threonylcarbamoyladenosine biosynthesis protein TsaE
MAEYITHSREETVELGRRLAAKVCGGQVIAFTGGLGAGKTAFCEGLAKGLGCTDPVSSPTFAIVNYYRGPRPLAHFDLYRISTEEDLNAAGFYDYLDQGVLVAAEWSENFAALLDAENPVRVDIAYLPGEENARRITIEGVSL